MTVTPFPGYEGPVVPMFDIEGILASIDTMAAQRPVAAHLVSLSNSEEVSAKELSRVLASDVALAGRACRRTPSWPAS